jgi:chemotaxis protein CheX
MEERQINPVVAAVKYVFKAMLDIDIKAGTSIVNEARKSKGDITGVMALTGGDGDQKGMLAFSTSKQGALQIYKRLMHQEFEEVNAEIIDGMGELTNIISGRARYELEKENIHLYAHVPIVFSGKNAEVNYITKTTVLSAPFSFTIEGTESLMNVDFVFE